MGLPVYPNCTHWVPQAVLKVTEDHQSLTPQARPTMPSYFIPLKGWSQSLKRFYSSKYFTLQVYGHFDWNLLPLIFLFILWKFNMYLKYILIISNPNSLFQLSNSTPPSTTCPLPTYMPSFLTSWFKLMLPASAWVASSSWKKNDTLLWQCHQLPIAPRWRGRGLLSPSETLARKLTGLVLHSSWSGNLDWYQLRRAMGMFYP